MIRSIRLQKLVEMEYFVSIWYSLHKLYLYEITEFTVKLKIREKSLVKFIIYS